MTVYILHNELLYCTITQKLFNITANAKKEEDRITLTKSCFFYFDILYFW